MLALVSMEKKREIIAELQNSPIDEDQIDLIATVMVRRFGNRDSNLAALVDTIFKYSSNLSRIEVIVKIDDDDDLLYFLRQKRRVGNAFRFRIFVTPRGAGYRDGHVFHDELVRRASSKAPMWIVLTDDSRVVARDWDQEILRAHQDTFSSFTVVGDRDLERILPPDACPAEPENDVPAHFWANDYPAASTALLAAIRDWPERPSQWTCFGDTFSFDAFFSAIVSHAVREQNLDIYRQTKPLVRRGGANIYYDDKTRSVTRTRAIQHMMSDGSVTRRSELLSYLARICRKDAVGEHLDV